MSRLRHPTGREHVEVSSCGAGDRRTVRRRGLRGHGRGAARERGGIPGEPAARRDGSEATTTFDLPACEAENAYSDGARIGLVDNGSAAGALLGDDRAYIMLVSEADLDVQRMADAHTGSCATYTVAYDDPASFGRTVRTERLDLPPELASEDAVIVSEVTHSDNPNWADDEVLLGYAAVGDYTVLVLAYHGKEFRTEFDDVFTRTVEKVRSHA
ncbi:hypothetical protein [Prescottella equi]|uniref:hypothetical protein n=1 Tax=Rhodococcus hoagii TaxID=43767 RepID=UPI0021B42680|nr:hypothetical protein [Prescottella equi]